MPYGIMKKMPNGNWTDGHYKFIVSQKSSKHLADILHNTKDNLTFIYIRREMYNSIEGAQEELDKMMINFNKS